MSGPWPRHLLDADPLRPEDVDPRYVQGWVDGIAHSIAVEEARTRRRDRLGFVAVVLATCALLVSAFFFGRASAAPRPAAAIVIPTGTSNGSASIDRTSVPSGNPSPQWTGAPPEDPRAPVQSAARPGQAGSGGAPTSSIVGVASYVRRSLGDRYLALPAGPGVRVRICSSSTRCLVRTSTDAGPDLAMQRRGRVADLSFVDFAWLCRCDPPRVGLLHVTVEELRAPRITPPPTDVRR